MDPAEKVRQLEELLQSDPGDADLHFLLGKALLDSGRAGEAAARLEEAARLNPELAAIRRFWGEALRDSGNIERAREVWSDGIALSEKTGDLQAGKEMRALMKKRMKAEG
jgi:cytochrome c-type biogenesis protein CcmH/NrfG